MLESWAVASYPIDEVGQYHVKAGEAKKEFYDVIEEQGLAEAIQAIHAARRRTKKWAEMWRASADRQPWRRLFKSLHFELNTRFWQWGKWLLQAVLSAAE